MRAIAISLLALAAVAAPASRRFPRAGPAARHLGPAPPVVPPPPRRAAAGAVGCRRRCRSRATACRPASTAHRPMEAGEPPRCASLRRRRRRRTHQPRLTAAACFRCIRCELTPARSVAAAVACLDMQPNGCILSPWTGCSRRWPTPSRRQLLDRLLRRQRADAGRALRTPRHDAAGGDQASGAPGGGEPRRHAAGAGARSCTTSTRCRSTRSPNAGSASSSAAAAGAERTEKETGSESNDELSRDSST